MHKFEILTGTNIQAARKLNAEVKSTPNPLNPFWCPLFDFDPVQREFYGRFDLALTLRETLEQLAGSDSDSILEAIETKLETEIYVYGKSIDAELLRLKRDKKLSYEIDSEISNSDTDAAN